MYQNNTKCFHHVGQNFFRLILNIYDYIDLSLSHKNKLPHYRSISLLYGNVSEIRYQHTINSRDQLKGKQTAMLNFCYVIKENLNSFSFSFNY